MTPSEFKAWFDGFTEAFSGCPTKAQWGRIKERVAEIDGKAVTERVYIDRYWPAYPSGYQRYPYWGVSGAATGMGLGCATSNNMAQGATSGGLNQIGSGGLAAFNSTAAMGDLGRAEAKSLAA